MNAFDSLERRFGRFAIPGLVRLIVALNALVFILSLWSPAMISWLVLDPAAVAHGQVWRLVTYIFIPGYGGIFTAVFGQSGSVLEVVFGLLFLWWIGDGLEQAWGTFRLNLFYLIGMLGTTVASFAFGADFSNGMLNLSLFFAFAWFYPNLQIYLFFILPVFVKWLAWFAAAMLFWNFVSLGSNSYRMAVIASLANFLLFFGQEILGNARQRHQVSQRREKFSRAALAEEEPLHRCSVCRRTDISNPELEFRVARDGNDYCTDHLPPRSNAASL